MKEEVMSLLFAFLDALLGEPTSTKAPSKRSAKKEESMDEICYGCGEYFEDCTCGDCDDEDCLEF